MATKLDCQVRGSMIIIIMCEAYDPHYNLIIRLTAYLPHLIGDVSHPAVIVSR